MVEMEMLMDLAKLGPIVSLLIIVIIYFLRKEKSYKEELKEKDVENDALNDELRDSEKETLNLIHKLVGSLDKINTSNETFHTELKSLKDYISAKLDERALIESLKK